MYLVISSDQCLNLLGWPSLKLRRGYLSVNLLYDIIINSKIAIKFSDFCSFVSSQTRQHFLSIFPLQTTINSLCYSFFGNVPFIWNKIPFKILSLADRNAFHRAVKPLFLVLCGLFCVKVSAHCALYFCI